MTKLHLCAGAAALALILVSSAPSMAQDNSMSVAPSPVAAVQERLNDLGYAAGPTDGIVGPKTRNAIRQFQSDAGLPVTGRIDDETLAALQGTGANSAIVDDPATIQKVESKLDSLGWAVGAIDGKIDDQLRIALTKYALHAGLPVNDQLTAATAIHVDRHELANIAEIGSKLLWDVETELTARGYQTGPIDGTADQFTFRAILDYEEDAGLPRNGQLNAILLDSLEIADTRPVTEVDVREIEDRLTRLGYTPGTIDGIADGQTEAAISAFQTDAGQAATGRPTLMLLSELARSATVSESFISQYGELYPYHITR